MKVAALIGLVAFAGCGAQPGEPSAPPMRTFTNAPAKLSARYPPAWFAAQRPISHVTSPKQRLAVATFPLHRWTAPERFPPGQALVYVQEFGGRYTPKDPPRPVHFSYSKRSRGFGLAGCTFGRSWPEHGFVWREKGRTFAAELVLGARASARTRRQALQILDSVRVGYRPADVPERTQ